MIFDRALVVAMVFLEMIWMLSLLLVALAWLL